jgi:hypothetical protein
VDLDSVTDELYALPPGEFTATRNERAKRARADGDRELAEQIKALDKPTTSAWLVNQLARQLGDQLEPLIDLGRELREATANISGEELRSLTRQRHQLVHALVQEARSLGVQHGTRVTDAVAGEVQRTLDASLADPDVAEAVLSGRLAHATEYAGFGEPMTGQAAPTSRRAPSRRQADRGAAKVTDLAARRRESAEHALADAEERLQSARSEHGSATEAEEDATASREQADQRVERLRAELETAHQDARAAGKTERTARERVQRAQRALSQAEHAREQAAARLAELADESR